jgi:transcriptional regulator with XRE-family HTH domain
VRTEFPFEFRPKRSDNEGMALGQGDLPAQLKRLRKRAGMTVRDVAAELDLPHTSYAHYESPRYKKPYLPLDLAERLAVLFERHGIGRAEVLALAGLADGAGSALTLADEAVPYDGDLPEASPLPLRHATDFWEIRGRALDLAGLLPGDVVAVDLRQSEFKAGDVVCAQIYDWQKGSATTVFRVYEPPYLIALSTDPQHRKPVLVDGEQVLLKGRVVASFRRYES